ncbi:MAG: radical SAM [Candidatus Methanomethylophilus sp.]|nr:radical SAM [Methanomethylophilus sp.]
MALDREAAGILSRGWYKEHLEPAECEYLLSFRDRSSEANLAVSLADRLNRQACTDTGRICVRIAVATGPCPANCGFCRYAESVTRCRFFDIDDAQFGRLIQEIEAFSDVREICLVTTGDADLTNLCRYIGIVKDQAPNGTQISVDTRDMDDGEAQTLRKAGACGAYHARRLGEGMDTQFKPEKRLNTIDSLVRAGLAVTAGVEPIGPEHTAADICGAFYEILNRNCCHAAVVPRTPVVGTKFNSAGTVNPARLAQIKAVLTLASGWYIPRIREPTPGCFVNGTSLATVTCGDEGVAGAPKQNPVETARRRLFNAGYLHLMRADSSAVDLDLGYLKRTDSV